MGLCSDGGVHCAADASVCAARDGEAAGRDGRFRSLLHGWPRHAAGKRRRLSSSRLQKKLRELGIGKIASVSGRYYAMDRDKRWERIERAFGAMVLGNGDKVRRDPRWRSVKRPTRRASPTSSSSPSPSWMRRNEPIGLIRDDDSVIMYNYRADRAREITHGADRCQARAAVPITGCRRI